MINFFYYTFLLQNLWHDEHYRGFIPGNTSSELLSPEWLTWLRGIRKLPPTQEEILANQQASEKVAIKFLSTFEIYIQLFSHKFRCYCQSIEQKNDLFLL